jgi:membrane protein YdbS with pleckstrin-like domain
MAKAGLASLKIQLASGSYSIPMIDAQIARQLQSYILNKVEVEAQPWM